MSINNIDLERVLRDLPVAEMRPSAYRRTLLHVCAARRESLDAAEEETARYRFRSASWHSLARRLVAAAIVLVVILAGLWAILPNTTVVAAVSFADVLREVRATTSVRYMMTICEDSRQLERVQISVADAGKKVRQISEVEGSTQIYDFSRGEVLYLSGNDDATGTLWKTKSQNGWDNPIACLAKLHETVGKACGTESFDGRQISCFEAVEQGQITRIWVDPATNLPVRIKISNAGDSTSGEAKSKYALLIDKIEWDCQIPESTFSMTLPPRYKWSDERVNASKPGDLLGMLKTWAELSDGHFPAELTWQSLGEFVGAKLKEAGKSQTIAIGTFRSTAYTVEEPWQNLYVQTRLGLRFVTKVSKCGWHYQGAGMQLGDNDAIICWWSDEDSPVYHVVYGDLTIRECTAEDLPSVRAH